MTLLLPLALLGLLTLPAILLLHLLRNRREQLTIPSLRLWQGLQKQKHGGLPRHIPLSLLLLLQLLIAAALTLALARPALSYVLNRPQHTIYILDTTTSMTAAAQGVFADSDSRFEQARRMIRATLENLSGQDRLSVVGLNNRPEIMLTGRAPQQNTLQLALDNLTPGGVDANLSQALTLANGLVDPTEQSQIIILSDGNLSLTPENLPPAYAPLTWELLGQRADNQALLHVSARPLPDGRHRLFARVANYSGAAVERTLTLWLDDEAWAEERLQIDAEADAVRLWTLPADAGTVAVEIVEADALPLDNRADLFLSNSAAYEVLLISDTPDVLGRAFSAQPDVNLTTVAVADAPPDLNAYDLVVSEGVEYDNSQRGTFLVVNPPSDNNERLPGTLRPEPDGSSALLTGIDVSGVYFTNAPRLETPPWAMVDLNGRTNAESPLTPSYFSRFAPPRQPGDGLGF